MTEVKALTIAGTEKLSKDVQDLLYKNLEEGKRGIDFRPPLYKIDHKGLVFMLDGSTDKKKVLEGVVVLKQKIRGIWEEGSPVPVCSSFDGVTGNDRVKQDIGITCAACPSNVWGSGKDGKGKACKEMRRVLLVESLDNLYPVVFTVPPTSLKIFDMFFSNLYHKKIPLLMVNIKFSLDRASGGGYDFAKIRPELAVDVNDQPITLTDPQIRRVAAIEKEFKKQFEAMDIEVDKDLTTE